MTYNIAACPFCGEDNVEIDEIDLRVFAVCCSKCNTIGPIKKTTVEDAVTAWNHRVQDDHLKELLRKAHSFVMEEEIVRQSSFEPGEEEYCYVEQAQKLSDELSAALYSAIEPESDLRTERASA